MHINFEFKARVDDPGVLEQRLKAHHPDFKGEDHQLDTYFNVNKGRLKLRQGNIEHALIWYERADTAGAKQSNVLLYQHQPDDTLKQILATSLGIKTVVDKKRRIYFIDNVKFHFDRVEGLGSFVEVEAIDKEGNIGMEKLADQCAFYANLFEIQPANYIANSYSDMLMEANAPNR
jgi:predicted adenylyl cyclase CyaB